MQLVRLDFAPSGLIEAKAHRARVRIRYDIRPSGTTSCKRLVTGSEARAAQSTRPSGACRGTRADKSVKGGWQPARPYDSIRPTPSAAAARHPPGSLRTSTVPGGHSRAGDQKSSRPNAARGITTSIVTWMTIRWALRGAARRTCARSSRRRSHRRENPKPTKCDPRRPRRGRTR